MSKNDAYSNESLLIEDLRSGSHDAFGFLIDRYQDKVFRTVMGFIHSIADAEDITQEVFIEVFRSVGRFRGEAGLSTWIYRIAVNKSINFQLNKRRRKIISFFDLSVTGENNMKEEPEAPSDSNPDSAIQRSEHAGALEKALANLPANQRTAFVLSKYDDLSYQEIAAVMQCSVSSVESLLFRARKNLQKKLYTYFRKSQ